MFKNAFNPTDLGSAPFPWASTQNLGTVSFHEFHEKLSTSRYNEGFHEFHEGRLHETLTRRQTREFHESCNEPCFTTSYTSFTSRETMPRFGPATG